MTGLVLSLVPSTGVMVSLAAEGAPVRLGCRAQALGECGDWQLLEGTKGRKTQLEFSRPPLQVWCLGSELFLPLGGEDGFHL